MPIILTAGADNNRTVPFWARHPLSCGNCGCEFEMDREEDHLVTEERSKKGDAPLRAHVYCPHCGHRVTVENADYVAPPPPEVPLSVQVKDLQAALKEAQQQAEDHAAAHAEAQQQLQQAQETIQAHEATIGQLETHAATIADLQKQLAEAHATTASLQGDVFVSQEPAEDATILGNGAVSAQA